MHIRGVVKDTWIGNAHSPGRGELGQLLAKEGLTGDRVFYIINIGTCVWGCLRCLLRCRHCSAKRVSFREAPDENVRLPDSENNCAFSRTRNNTSVNPTVLFTSGKGEPIREIQYNFSNVSLEESGLRATLESLKIARRYRAKHIVVYIDDECVASIADGSEIPPRLTLSA